MSPPFSPGSYTSDNLAILLFYFYLLLNMKCKLIGIIFMLLIAGAVLFAGCTSTQQGSTPASTVAITNTPGSSQESILVFAGAGLKAPLDEIGPAFTQKYGIAVQYNYGGAGTLVSQMNLTRKGDVFMPGSTTEFQTAKDQGLVDYKPACRLSRPGNRRPERQPEKYHVPKGLCTARPENCTR